MLVGLSVVSGILWGIDTHRLQRRYREKVGLDLAGLINLLPAELRRHSYSRFRLGPWQHGRISVGLCYGDGRATKGSPPNVGLSFDPDTGALLQVHPEGIGLGLK